MRSYYLSIEVPFIGTSSLAGQVSFGEEERSFREHKKGKKLLIYPRTNTNATLILNIKENYWPQI